MIVGTRKSPLALKQVEEILGYLKKFSPGLEVEIKGIDTYGDKDKATSISDIERTDFFTREIEEALLKGEIDFAVHSAKDLPDKIPNGLCIAAVTKSIDPYDVLVSKDNLQIDQLRQRAKIGASSERRKLQLKKFRSDFQVVDIRGTIHERLTKLDSGGLDAVIIAACALIRLGLEERITQRIPFEILKPHPLQGSLAVETRQDNTELVKLLSKIDTRI